MSSSGVLINDTGGGAGPAGSGLAANRPAEDEVMASSIEQTSSPKNMATSDNLLFDDRDRAKLTTILSILDAPVSEEEAWALLHEMCKALGRIRAAGGCDNINQPRPTSTSTDKDSLDIYLNKEGNVDDESLKGENCVP